MEFTDTTEFITAYCKDDLPTEHKIKTEGKEEFNNAPVFSECLALAISEFANNGRLLSDW